LEKYIEGAMTFEGGKRGLYRLGGRMDASSLLARSIMAIS